MLLVSEQDDGRLEPDLPCGGVTSGDRGPGSSVFRRGSRDRVQPADDALLVITHMAANQTRRNLAYTRTSASDAG
jgi:hypothetical protein